MHKAFGKFGSDVTPAAPPLRRAGVLLALIFPLLLLAFSSSAVAGTQVKSARIWPAQDYTRLTLESVTPIRHSLFTVKNPERLVLDLEEVDLTPELQNLPEKVGPDDPYIRAVRVGRFKPGIIRVVLDLKTEVQPQAFLLKPVADYGHRLVLDVYPANPVDPLMALVLNPDKKLDSLASSGENGEKQVSGSANKPAEVATIKEAQVEKPKSGDDNSPAPAPSKGGQAANSDKASREDTDKIAKPPDSPKASKSAKREVARLITIAIDAGHGGEDPGAKGRRGTYEKNVTLAIARKLKARIDAEPGMRAVLTRDGDYFIPLQMRVNKARRVNADLFVSIHADAYIKPHARGSSVFALSERGATSAAARWLAKKENEADLIGGVNLDVKDPYLKQTLLDLSQTATINDSLKLARDVLAELSNVNRLHRDEVEQAGFAVLKAPDIPSILVETAFISNPDEEKRLKDDAYQDEMAEAILTGIKRYFAKNPPLARSKLAQNL